MVLKILQDIKRILESRGWIQRSYVSYKGVCLNEAYMRAMRNLDVGYDTSDTHRARDLILNEITIETGRLFSMVRYNDAEGRTKEQVLNLLDRAIAKAT